MTAEEGFSSEDLLRQAESGSHAARDLLLDCHRSRLRQMVSVRMDPRVAGRIDPSDVVQEVMAEASQKLSEYLQRKPLPFYLWLRQLAWDQLIDLHRKHVKARKRSVLREEIAILSEDSANDLAGRLFTSGSSPSERMIRDEELSRVREALDQLPRKYHEVLVMRYLEQLSNKEVATVLSISERTAHSHHRQALEYMQQLLTENRPGEP